MMALTRFEGKVALVTGAASGIGEATALAFADEGASVVVADIQEDEGRAVVDTIRGKGVPAIYIHCDVRSEDSVRDGIGAVVSEFGRLDCAFNNAGIAGMVTPLIEGSSEIWDNVVATDLRGTWLCMKYEIQQMLRQGGGCIVNCASVCGLVGAAGMASYVAAKHGIIGLTRSGALDYAMRDIRINAICPGTTLTAAVERNIFSLPQAEREQLESFLFANQPNGRWGKPEEIADAVLWLSSPGASLMLGHALAVDGGWTIC
jgi:NAD(P)-dependent dehydrogenase (short-subunit alcohol dehydrogenase family)